MNRQEQLLVILSEECSEIIKDVSKALRFGLNDKGPTSEFTNKINISKEIADLVSVYEMLVEEGIIDPYSQDDVDNKKRRVEHYFDYSKYVGTLDIKDFVDVSAPRTTGELYNSTNMDPFICCDDPQYIKVYENNEQGDESTNGKPTFIKYVCKNCGKINLF